MHNQPTQQEDAEQSQETAYVKPSEHEGKFGIGDKMTFYVDGKPIEAEVVQAEDVDGVVVQTSERVNGHLINQYTREELDALTAPPQQANDNADAARPQATETGAEVQNETEGGKSPDELPAFDGDKFNETHPVDEIRPTEEQKPNEENNAVDEASAISKIPQDESGEYDYMQAEPSKAWAALLEQTEGDADMAREVAQSMLNDKVAELEEAQKQQPKEGKSVAEKIAARKEHKANIERIEKEIEQWRQIIQSGEERQAEEKSRSVEADETPAVETKPESGVDGEVKSEDMLQPIGKGVFGNIYDQFKGKVKEAFDFLTKHKSGDLLGVFHRDGFGDIDLVWGDNGGGLAHIVQRHVEEQNDFNSVEEVRDVIDDVIKNGSINERKSKWDKVVFEKDGYSVVVSRNLRDKDGNIIEQNKDWVVTAFDNSRGRNNKKRESSSDVTQVTPNTNKGGRAVAPNDNSSESKDTKSKAEGQEKSEESKETSLSEQISTASAEVDTNPTEAQKEAGNYKKGHVQVGTFDITIEQPQGSIRRGKDANGRQWEHKMHNTYGYFRGTEGVDGDHIDVFLSNYIDDWNGRKVFVVDQYNPDGTFDEHKVMLGFNDVDEAKSDYLANYEKGWENGRRIDVTPVNLEDFEKWIGSSHRKTKAFAEYAGVKKEDLSASENGEGKEKVKPQEEQKPKKPTKKKGEESKAEGASAKSADEQADFVVRRVKDFTNRKHEETGAGEAMKKESGLSFGNGKAKRSVKFGDFIPDRRSEQQQLRGIHYDNGMAVISDGYRLVAIRTEYPAEYEGRTLLPNGQEAKGKYPNWRGVVPNGGIEIGTDWLNRVLGLQLKEDEKRLVSLGRNPRWSSVTNVTSVMAGDLLRLAKLAEKISNPRLFYAQDRLLLTGDGVVCLQMLHNGIENEDVTLRDFLNGNVPSLHRAGESNGELTKAEVALRDAVVGVLRKSGIDVVSDVSEGQRVLDMANGKERLSGKQKRALETATIADESTNKATVVSSADGAKVQNNLEILADSYQKLHNRTKGFITDLSRSLGLEQHEASQYGTFVTGNGKTVTIRVSNHNAKVSNFDRNGENDGISIVISSHKNKGLNNDGNAHVTEFFYPRQSLERADGKPLSEIIRSVSEALKNGEFKDTTGLAQRQEVNGDVVREHRVYHGSGADFDSFDHSHMGEGEGAQAYGWGTYVTEVEGIGRTYAVNNTTKHRDALRALQHDIDAISGQLDMHRDELKNDEEQLKRANDWRAEAELDYELFQEKAEERKKEYGEDSPEYRNLLFNDIYTDEMKRAQRSVESTEDSIRYRKEKIAELEKALNDKKAEMDELPKKFPRHLYSVEIPDDNGKNYLDWNERLSDSQIEAIRAYLSENYRRNKLEDFDASIAESKGAPNADEVNAWARRGENVYKMLSHLLGSDDAASKALSEMGFAGIKYPAENRSGGRKDGARNYVIFNEGDAKIVDKVRFFKTRDGEAYGFVVGGKIYIDPRIASSETAVHEYAHLWAEALRSANAKEWGNVVGLMRGTSVWNEVRERYPELKSDDEIADEVLATYSGRRGSERLREEMDRIKGSERSVSDKARALGALERVKRALDRFWHGVADFLGIHYKSADEVADRVMRDLLNGVDPRRLAQKKVQNDIVQRENPMLDDYHTGIRSEDDIHTFAEAVSEAQREKEKYGDEQMSSYPDITDSLLNEAIKTGKITIYSSKPIKDGVFVTPSRMQAQDYAGGRGAKVYSKEVSIESVAWIDVDEGQFAEVKNAPMDKIRFQYIGEMGADERRASLAEETEDVSREDQMFLRGEGGVQSMSYDYEKYPTGKVEPNLADKEIGIVQAKSNHGFKNFGEAKEWAKNNIARTYDNEETGGKGNIRISNTAIGKFLTQSAVDKSESKDVHLAVLKVLPDVIRESVDAETHPDFNKDGNEVRSAENSVNKNVLMHRLYGAVDIDGKTYRVKVTLKEDKQNENLPQKAYSYEATKIELLTGTLGKPEDDAPRANNSITGAKLLKDVGMSYDPTKKLLDESKKNETDTTLFRDEVDGDGAVSSSGVDGMRERAVELGRELGADVDVVSDVSEISDANPEVQERKRRAKGWYDAKTGRVVINLAAHSDMADVEQTLLHEIVGHRGLRGLVGHENFNGFLDGIYEHASGVVREGIDDIARRKGCSKRVATEEYMSGLAEGGFADRKNAGLWQQIRQWCGDMLSRAKIKLKFSISDNELRYLLWRSHELSRMNGREGVVGRARDLAMQNRLGVGNGVDLFRTSKQLDAEYGSRWIDEQTNADGRHTTQVKNTVNSYKKFGEWVQQQANGKKVDVLDASSGLGVGTEWLREHGMNVDDVEPYPSENRTAPTYSSYEDIDKRYDYIISNAVLNVIPEDWRADVLHSMADKLKVGGKLVINVRGAESIRNQGTEGQTRITLDDASEILVLRPNGTIKAYQKGFTKAELKGWCEKELGDGYSVEVANSKNAGGSYDTAVVVTKNDESNTIGVASGATHPSRIVQEVRQPYEDTQDFAQFDSKVRKKSEYAEGLSQLSSEIGQKKLGAHEFLYGIAKAFGFKGNNFNHSMYRDLGGSVGIRISDHSANAENFSERGSTGENYGLVVKLSPHRFRSSENVDYLEYTYYPDKLTQERQKEIVDGLKDFLQTGDYSKLPSPDRVNKSGTFEQESSVDSYDGDLKTLFRDADSPVDYERALIRDSYERRMKDVWFQSREALQDGMLSLKETMKDIWRSAGKKFSQITDIPDYANPYLGQNRLSSRNAAEVSDFKHRLFRPLLREVGRLTGFSADGRAKLTDYMMAKHGLERNKVMAERDAKHPNSLTCGP